MTDAPLRIDVHLRPDDLRRALRTDALEGLTSVPKALPPKWFYDDTGCELFEKITKLPEYYPTRRESEILRRHAPSIAERSGADTLVELGSGTSEKTRTLLGAMASAGILRRFVPFEISESTLRASCSELRSEHPDLEIWGVVGDFEHHLEQIPRAGRRLVAFLGSTIGNLTPAERGQFLAELAANLQPGEYLLLGTDLVKEPERLRAAYDDASGVTAEFNLNVLRVLNRELGADFDPEQFEHVALWDPEREWMEMRLRSLLPQRVTIRDLDLQVGFEAGEEMRTEISAKFRRAGVERELAAAGLRLQRWMTDESGDFALSLSLREGRA